MLIIFDLDGTLIDSSVDLSLSMNATRAHFALPSLDPHLIYSYVGDGAAMLVRRSMPAGTAESQLSEALAFFLRFYRVHALEHTRLYPGVREVVEELSGSGQKLAVLTNKPARISFDIVAALGLKERFLRVYGGDSFAYKKPDPIGISQLMQDADTSAAMTLMVGDSAVDVRTASNAGVRSCGVLWGFQPDSFEAAKPDVLISEPRELLRQVSAFG